jgi:hypothetical protein
MADAHLIDEMSAVRHIVKSEAAGTVRPRVAHTVESNFHTGQWRQAWRVHALAEIILEDYAVDMASPRYENPAVAAWCPAQ